MYSLILPIAFDIILHIFHSGLWYLSDRLVKWCVSSVTYVIKFSNYMHAVLPIWSIVTNKCAVTYLIYAAEPCDLPYGMLVLHCPSGVAGSELACTQPVQVIGHPYYIQLSFWLIQWNHQSSFISRPSGTCHRHS